MCYKNRHVTNRQYGEEVQAYQVFRNVDVNGLLGKTKERDNFTHTV